MNKLVNKALQEGMQIMTVKQADRIFQKHWPNCPADNNQTCLANCHVPEIGLGKTIVVSLEKLFDFIKKGNLGLIERGLAHEIGHILTDIAEGRPNCCRNPSKDWPCYFYCAYREAIAERVGLEQLKCVCHWNLKTHLVLFGGQKVTLFKLLVYFGWPELFSHEVYYCQALKAHRLSRCPKRKKIIKLIEEIMRLLK